MIKFLIIMLTFFIYLSIKTYRTYFRKYKPDAIVPLLFIFFFSPVIINLLTRFDIVNFSLPVIHVMYLLLGCFIFLFIYNILFDILWLVRLRIKFIHGYPRRVGIATLVLTILTVSYGYYHHDKTIITTYNIETTKEMKQDLRIVAVADHHIGSNMSLTQLAKSVEMINSLDADIVVFLGDVVDSDIRHLTPEMQAEFRKIKSKYGLYSIFGNHEYYSGDKKEIMRRFDNSGFITLQDEVVYLDDFGMYLVGRDDSQRYTMSGAENYKPTDLSVLLADVDKNKPIVILDHIPDTMEDGKSVNADIQLSGHTHHGQFFPVSLIVQMMYPIAHGVLEEDGFNMIVTSGLGLWGPPMRIGTNSEILLVTLSGAEPSIETEQDIDENIEE